MIQNIIDDAVRNRRKEQESILKEAFLRHFGFPFDEIKDKENLDRVIKDNPQVQIFRYRGEGFLLWDESDGFSVESGVNYWRGTLTAKYMML